MKWVLGLGGSNHDFSATLLRNGHPHTIIEDERISGHRYGDRHWASSPCLPSVEYCLRNANISLSDIDAVFVSNDIEGHNRFWEKVPHQLVSHHVCHAAAAYYSSPFERAATLVIDGKGGPIGSGKNGKRNFETISTGLGIDTNLELETIQSGEHLISTSTWKYISSNSIGWFYSIVTECIGMGPEGEGKTMALAAFGKPTFKNELLDFVKFDTERPFEMDPYGGLWTFIFELITKNENSFSVKADLAASAQAIIEDAILLITKTLKKKTKERYLVYGGGVALNGVVNTRIREESGFDDLFVFPASGDNGLSSGAALYGYHHVNGHKLNERSLARSISFAQPGKVYSNKEIEKAAREFSVSTEDIDNQSDIIERIVMQLMGGSVLALYQGGSEFGPRALGNRSLIALPSTSNIQRRMNKIKRRETFRPFAPIVLEEKAEHYFEISAPSPFMLEIAPIRKEFRTQLSGAAHVDGSARVQTIAPYQKGLIRPILLELEKRGLPPVILNTSFNLKGRPIVETPYDAIKAFLHLDVDALIMESFWVEKHGSSD